MFSSNPLVCKLRARVLFYAAFVSPSNMHSAEPRADIHKDKGEKGEITGSKEKRQTGH